MSGGRGSVLLRQHDRHDTRGHVLVRRVGRAVVEITIVAIDLPEDRLAGILEAAEIVLAVRVVVRRKGDEAMNAPHDLDLLLRLGIPLVFIELKAPHVALKSAYDDNLRDYRGQSIPQLFHPNAFIMLSNGSETRVGTITSEWEHFFEWKRIADEEEEGEVSIERALRGLCDRRRLLDVVENFIAFEETKGGLVKKVAQNHQYLGVNRAIARMRELQASDPDTAKRLGVFWHTQGSGKSLSMVFFTEKIHRKIPGKWTFVIVTDREELDDQISKTFKAVGAVSNIEARAKKREHLKQLLTQDERYVFTLIQKFQTTGGEPYPKLSDRSDIIVITDEAHRSQYDIFALNMRSALPHAGFLGFTGTPLIEGEEERTREVFGDYVSVYDFARSVEDGATVPLFYENRIPELQLTNENLGEDMQRLLEDAELDAEQEKVIERRFARQYHLIVRPERLDAIAKDIVQHFVGRGYRGKAMMVCIDKATAVSMYDRVQQYWKEHIEALKASLQTAAGDRRAAVVDKIALMETTDMAVVVSQSQNEVEDLKAKGLDIVPHRKRMMREDLDETFKDPASNLRLVFVCAKWITGFDVPTCSTLYLDKPIRNHTLMQTIARHGPAPAPRWPQTVDVPARPENRRSCDSVSEALRHQSSTQDIESFSRVYQYPDSILAFLPSLRFDCFASSPNFRNLFMKKLTRERVVPIISARVSWLTFAMTGSGRPSLPKFASKRRVLARRFSLELNN